MAFVTLKDVGDRVPNGEEAKAPTEQFLPLEKKPA